MLTLSPALLTGHADIDHHHQQFVTALGAIDAVADGDVLDALDRFIAHCEEHFAFENDQMQASHFPPIGCHRGEHDMVIETARAVRQRAAAGETALAKSLGPALSEWFENHVQSMDAVLARYLAQPEALRAAPSDSAAPACGAPA